MNKGQITLLVIGIIVLLVSIGMLAAGGTLLWLDSTIKDGDGFYCTRTIRIEKGSYAIVAVPDSIAMQGIWDWPWRYGYGDLGDLTAFKVEGSNNDPLNQVFIGVATASELDDYLTDVELDEISSLHIIPSSVDYRHHPGNAVPGNPATQTFWIESTLGTGSQVLKWDFVEPAGYSLVLMNGDGSAGIDMSIVLGVKAPLIEDAVEFFVFGGVFLLFSVLVIYLSVRRRSTTVSESPEAPPSTEN
ncbi:MAG: hypothetical protein JSW16_03310 [Dehalococcoidales bacterium]|nr:MAG: hypothetical protein JSW16_03310 [Dehalococcoidales bacterium]